MILNSIAAMVAFADFVLDADMVPKGLQVGWKKRKELSPEQIRKAEQASVIVAAQLGSELGLAPMQSLQSIAVINGIPGVYGDTALGIFKASGQCESIREVYNKEGTEADMGWTCTIKRKGEDPVSRTYTMADAKRAGLWGKDGPWTTNPSRMLQFRARGFCLRDVAPDILKGLKSAEEVEDCVPKERDITPPELLETSGEKPQRKRRSRARCAAAGCPKKAAAVGSTYCDNHGTASSDYDEPIKQAPQPQEQAPQPQEQAPQPQEQAVQGEPPTEDPLSDRPETVEERAQRKALALLGR